MVLRGVLEFLVRQRSIDDGHAIAPRRFTPLTIDPLPPAHRRGLIAIGITSLLSVITTVGLFLFITYRLIFWRKYHSAYIGYNQYIILIYNLLIADFQEALGFLLSLEWVARNSLSNESRMCPIQGWLLQIGDPSSGIFVMAIAIHTFVIVVLGRKMSHRVFVSFVVGLWAFCLLLVVIPTAMHGRKTFSPSGAWCWIDEDYEVARFWGHYFWIFIAEFGSIAIYSILFFYLRRQVSASPLMGHRQKEHLRRLRRVTGYMVLYPLAYIILSLPLAAGRMAMAGGTRLSVAYLSVAGALISSSGFVDVVMYALTRRALLLDSQPSNCDRAYGSGRYQMNNTHIATVTAGHRTPRAFTRHPSQRRSGHRDNTERGPNRGGSVDRMIPDDLDLEVLGFGMGKVYQKTTIEITSEPLDNGENNSSGEGSTIDPSYDSASHVDSVPNPGRTRKAPK
ncbi:hypothetical protein PRK78_002229 [Emydomyces testavorans]|uniref:G-protein coupled receptors family 2 profile 2 domain-containing protein n=1 Tax=Emydomyces testavorans TaxID=2070801 RepID=A0AAF0DDS2_9EURO|nr:hypothetical protein PRK78_002229 [Emydomyces testavorans]